MTVAPLVKAWGFARERAGEPLNMASLLEFVGYEGIAIVDSEIIKRDSRIQIDLNSIAKGFAVDCLAELLEQRRQELYGRYWR